MSKIGDGLHMLTAYENEMDNGCVVNAFQQITGGLLCVGVAVNKANGTYGKIVRTSDFKR